MKIDLIYLKERNRRIFHWERKQEKNYIHSARYILHVSCSLKKCILQWFMYLYGYRFNHKLPRIENYPNAFPVFHCEVIYVCLSSSVFSLARRQRALWILLTNANLYIDDQSFSLFLSPVSIKRYNSSFVLRDAHAANTSPYGGRESALSTTDPHA